MVSFYPLSTPLILISDHQFLTSLRPDMAKYIRSITDHYQQTITTTKDIAERDYKLSYFYQRFSWRNPIPFANVDRLNRTSNISQ